MRRAGSAPAPAPRITCKLRQDLGREDGRRNGFRQPRWRDSSHGWRRLVWILAGEARRRTRLPFSRLPALTTAATGAAQDSLEASDSPSGRKTVLLKEQLLLAQTLREWELEEGRARIRREECLRPAERGGKVPVHT